MASLDEFARSRAILAELDKSGRVMVTDLVDQFGVSAVTVRKDLDALERRSMLRRVRGGAVPAGETDEGSFDIRVHHGVPAKLAIAKAVAPLVDDGDVIALDSSTTAYYLARQLLDRWNLVVVTNGMRTADLFLQQSQAMVLMPGGVLRRSAESMVGPISDVLSGRGRIDKGFFGLMGLSTERGLLDMVAEEAHTKALLAQACNQVYGLFDSTKVGKFGLHSFASPDQITALYTDDGLAPDVVAQWREVDVPIEVAEIDSDVVAINRAHHRPTRRTEGGR